MSDCKTGADHIKSLKDGRTVFLDGKAVGDVTTHPAFRNAIHSAAALYDFQARPDNLEFMTFQPNGSNRRVSRAWQMPRSYEEMVQRRKALQAWAVLSCGFLGRSPDHLASALVGQRMSLEYFSQAQRRTRQGVRRLFRLCQHQRSVPHLCHHQSAGRARQGAGRTGGGSVVARVVDEDSSGITIRGPRCSARPRSWPMRCSSPICNRSSRAKRPWHFPARCR